VADGGESRPQWTLESKSIPHSNLNRGWLQILYTLGIGTISIFMHCCFVPSEFSCPVLLISTDSDATFSKIREEIN